MNASRTRSAGLVALLLAGGAALAACGSSGTTATPSSSAATSSAPSNATAPSGSPTISTTASSVGGTASVLYAGSLTNLFEKTIGPAFSASRGAKFSGYGAGSTAVATAIKGKVKTGDVFVSASKDADTALEGSANGDWVSWYSSFATSPLVIGYNPKSKFAADLKSKPWYDVLTEPGIKIGYTDPKLDPKGKLTVKALMAAQTQHGLAGFASKIESSATVYPEQELVGRLQSGQLDAGFFYTNESVPAKIATVTLGDVKEAATFTVTVLNRAPDEAAGVAFVQYLLSTAGKATLTSNGLSLTGPTLSGSQADVPVQLRNLVGAG